MNTATKKSPFKGIFLYESFLIAIARRDFLRDAVFFVMMPRLAALSIDLYAAESFSFASALFLAATETRTLLTATFMARFRRSLKTFLRADARSTFFADDVIGIILDK